MGLEIGISAIEAQRVLEHLAQRNLLDVRTTGEVRYQFRPGEPELERAALQFTETFRSNPLPVTKLVTSSGGRTFRDFADAFRIWRHDR